MMDPTEGYGAYVTYLAVKRHFDSDYDFHKYNGRVRASQKSFLERSDRFHFKRAQKQHGARVAEYFVANFRHGREWVGEFDAAAHSEWLKVLESFSYRFGEDVARAVEESGGLNSLLKYEDGRVPALMQMEMSGRVQPETVVALDWLLSFLSSWDKPDFVLRSRIRFYRKLAPFVLERVKLDRAELRKKVLDIAAEANI